VHIKVTLNNSFVRTRCVICGAGFKMWHLAYDAYDEDGERLGVLCEVCCTLDVEALRTTLREQAAALRAEADDLEALADDDFRLPSAADVAAAQRVFDEQHFGGVP
jgi:hypothetical protein